MRPPSSGRSVQQLAESRILEWQMRQKAAGNTPSAPTPAIPQASASAKVPVAPKTRGEGDLDFDDREEQAVDDGEEGK